MPRFLTRRLWTMMAGLVVFVGAGAVLGLPELLARKVSDELQNCGEPRDGDLCRFIGGPLELAGQPVFLPNFPHAFLPTSAQVEFVDATGDVWTAPPQTLTDGATIPPIFAPLMGDRQSREYLMAAALHDAYCGVGNEDLPTFQTRAWEDVHRMFYEALLVNGTPSQKAKFMFAAVYLGGPRWDDPARDLDRIAPEILLQELEWCLEWIQLKEPSLARIQSWMTNRETVMKSGNHTIPKVLQDARGDTDDS